ncbi:hypothetical protein ALON55S_05737 [Alishewanella longhuensis]
MNYHSRVPVISGVASDFRTPAIQSDLGFLDTERWQYHQRERTESGADSSKGLLEYPEDIKLYGASFNTNLGTTSVAGEFSFRQDEPLQIDDVEIFICGYARAISYRRYQT